MRYRTRRETNQWLPGMLVASVVVAGSFAGWPIERAAGQRPVELFKAVDIGTTDLNERQGRILSRLRAAPTTVGDVQIVRLAKPTLVEPNAMLLMDLGPDRRVEITVDRVKRAEGRMRIDCSGPDARDAAVLSMTDSATTGLIVTADGVYSVEPLGDGLQAVVRLDQSKFHRDEPPEFKQIEAEMARPLVERADPRPAADAPPITITVLVAYTPAVEKQVLIQSLINGAVGLTNASYENSNVNIELELVHTVEVDYTESGTFQGDLDFFRGENDPFMKNVHKLRNNHKADLCVLLVDDKDACGLAGAILAKEDTAFAVVHYECAVKNLSFPHEIGHLQGARHDLNADRTIDPRYPFNHGYLNPKGDWRTIMAYPTMENPNRIPYWSNPKVQYGGAPMGTPAMENNALMLNASALDLSRFR